MTVEESRLVIGALARLGFHLEPAEGWQGGRAPVPADLSVALGYAGLDARHMRALPSAEELRALPQSIDVDGRAFLSERAPDLAVDQHGARPRHAVPHSSSPSGMPGARSGPSC